MPMMNCLYASRDWSAGRKKHGPTRPLCVLSIFGLPLFRNAEPYISEPKWFASRSGPAAVNGAVTVAAQGDHILLAVRAGVAAKYEVVDFEPFAPAAVLTTPAVTLQDLHSQVTRSGEFLPLSILANGMFFHAEHLICWRKARCWGGRSKPKNRVAESNNMSGSPSPKFAPAKKSAQIISRQ